MLPNGANQSYNPYSPAYPTYLPQQSMYNQNAPVQLPSVPQYSQTRPIQPMFTQQIVNLAGRVVQNEQEITPQEVAMDGSISLFPLSDYSTIIAKQWNSDGTIKTLRFVPEVVTASEEVTESSDFATHFDKRMDELLKAVKNQGHYNSSRKPYNKQSAPKQEGENNA